MQKLEWGVGGYKILVFGFLFFFSHFLGVCIFKHLFVCEILENENVFSMDEERAQHQDIRALQVAILNLMPTKIATETQILRLLSNSALQVEITLLHTASYESKNTDAEHLLNHYF